MAVDFCCLHLVATGAVGTAAAGSALASIILSCCNIHHYALSVALLSHINKVVHLVSLLRALGGISAVAVSALVRHGR